MTPENSLENSKSKRVIKTADVVEEIRKMNNTMWTPELEKELSRDVIRYVVETQDSRGLLYVGMKYNLSPEGIVAKLQQMSARSLVALNAKWAAFKAGRLTGTSQVNVGGLPPRLEATQLVP